MRLADHAVAPEDVMALLDGELGVEEVRVVAAHVEECAECGEIARQFRAVSESMAAWTVEDAPQSFDAAPLLRGLKTFDPGAARRKSWNWKLWTGAGGVAVAGLLILSIAIVPTIVQERHASSALKAQRTAMGPIEERMSTSGALTRSPAASENFSEAMAAKSSPAPASGTDSSLPAMVHIPAPAPPPPPPVAAMTRNATDGAVMLKGIAGGGGAPSVNDFALKAPMIARTVSLTIVVKDVPAARAELERVLAHYQGYAAQLTVNTPEGGARSFQASLRVPAPELASALSELRALGRVQNESQSGEEVTQQHADLLARLQNSRETEQRLKDILTQRTGKIEDVLQVEEEIARVRGEIEGMEADQKTLEHRVDFASVDLQMNEVYTAQLGSPPASVGNQVRNAFVSGLRMAGTMMLGLLMFVEEAGPAMLIWVVILGVPGWMLWRRYKRMRARV